MIPLFLPPPTLYMPLFHHFIIPYNGSSSVSVSVHSILYTWIGMKGKQMHKDENKINDRKEFIDKVIRVTKDSFPFMSLHARFRYCINGG